MANKEAGDTKATVTAATGCDGGLLPLKKGPWTASEDAILMEYVLKHGKGKWNLVHKNSGLQRNGKSCRLRWVNQLRPDLKKGAFTAEEEKFIHRLHDLHGNKWSLIASKVQGRTDNEIKNYWNTKKKRRQRTRRLLSSVVIQQQMNPIKFEQGSSATWKMASPPAPATPTQMEGKPPLSYAVAPTASLVFYSSSIPPMETIVGPLSTSAPGFLLQKSLLCQNASGTKLQETIGKKDLSSQFHPSAAPFAAVSTGRNTPSPAPAVASRYVAGNFELKTTHPPILSPSDYVKMELPSSQVFSDFNDGEQNITPTQGNTCFMDALLHNSFGYGVLKLFNDDLCVNRLETQQKEEVAKAKAENHDTSTLFDIIPAHTAATFSLTEWYNGYNNSEGGVEYSSDHTLVATNDDMGVEIQQLTSILSMAEAEHDYIIGSSSWATCPVDLDPFL